MASPATTISPIPTRRRSDGPAPERERASEAGQAAGLGGTLPAIVAANFKRLDKNTLIGSADLTVVRWKLTFRGCLWFRKGSKEWINFPGREWTRQRRR